MSGEIFYKTATELSTMLAAGKISSRELTQSVIDRTRRIDDKLGSFLSYDEKKTLREADESDARRKSGKTFGVLDGIPVGIKDIISEKGQPLTCASKILGDYVSPYDATVIERMRSAGCVLWGRLNMDEFAMGSSGENSAFKVCSNPWDMERVPGGSSAGSAAAVASGETILALGSDTGGSIRQPAALTGIVGLKPSYGAVSRYGVVAFASSLDQVGPFGRSVKDVASLFQVIAGRDELDSSSCKFDKPDYIAELASNKCVKKIGVPKEYFGAGLDSDIREKIEDALEFYRANGYEVKDISLPMTEYAIPVYYILATAEASSNLARFDGVRYGHRSDKATDHVDMYFKSRGEGFGNEVKRRIMLGTFVLSSGKCDSYYGKAQRVRTLIRQDFTRAFDDVDVIITPVSPCTAFKKGEKSTDPLQMYLSDIATVSASLAGICGISVPCGFSKNGLPIGMQILGKPFREQDILTVANKFEVAHEFCNMHPNI